MFITTPHADTDGDMLDTVVMGIVFLAGALGLAYFGIDSVTDGIMVIVDTIRTIYAGILQIISAALFHDVIPGPIAEDDTIHVVIFTVRDYLGLNPNAYYC